jgi:FixJ family two-component response regulator
MSYKGTAQKNGRKARQVNTTPHRFTVHIVDDEPEVRDSLCWLIQSMGMLAVAYPSAQAFFASVPSHSCGVAIIDVHMPAMDGIQMIREMSARSYLMPVITVTGNGDWETAKKANAAGAIDYLEKPFDDEDIRFALIKAMSGSIAA